jgi:5-methylcytosine-specific restriction endonuclease McrA
MNTTHALLLNADYRPIRLLTWERAFHLIFDEKADLVVGYAGELVRSAYLAFEKPAVIRLRRYVELRGRVRFNRSNVLARDAYQCMYCGERPTSGGGPDLEVLTLDHVVPRAQSVGGRVRLAWAERSVAVTCWENVVTACYGCNMRKADRTPEQAGMTLLRHPRAPTNLDVLRMSLRKVHIPNEWRDFLPLDSGWRDYWVVELED